MASLSKDKLDVLVRRYGGRYVRFQNKHAFAFKSDAKAGKFSRDFLDLGGLAELTSGPRNTSVVLVKDNDSQNKFLKSLDALTSKG